jgi:hypothetical protein
MEDGLIKDNILVTSERNNEVYIFQHNTIKIPKKVAVKKMHSSNYLSDRQSLKIYHQNIRGLRRKTNELLCHLYSDLPHLLCFTKHRLKQIELDQINIPNYVLGAKYCRKTIQKGGVRIFVHESLQFTLILPM